jgi:hypothetical protein
MLFCDKKPEEHIRRVSAVLPLERGLRLMLGA